MFCYNRKIVVHANNVSKNIFADLGYFIGYKIVKSYYKQARDKQQAIKDIIEMNDPITFLQKSKYDRLPKN
jgi:uncharacterized protein YbjQ (UPF0145 family)